MDIIFETIYEGEFDRNSLNKRLYERDRIIDRVYSSNINYCWEIVDKNGISECKSEFESGNFRNLCWFMFDDELFCFSPNFTKIFQLNSCFNIEEEYCIENPFTHIDNLGFLRAGYTKVSSEIPFIFGPIWFSADVVKYFSTLKINKIDKTAKWLHSACKEFLQSSNCNPSHKEYEKELINERGITFPLRTFYGETLIDDIIWDGEKYTIKKYNTFQYHPQRPAYSLVELDKNGQFISYGKIDEKPLCYSYPNKYLFIPPSYTDHLNLMNNHMVLGSPNSFYNHKKANARKTNNQYLWDINLKSFIDIPLPKEFKEFYIHYIELGNFMTISKYDKENNLTNVMNMDLRTGATKN